MKPIALGVIGCGVIGQHHLSAAKNTPMLTIAAISEVREETARTTAAAFNVPKVYSTAEALLDDPDIQAVILALPAAPRTALALRAFARGKHVLNEKPIAMNSQEVRQMIAARGKLTAACCSSRMRFTPSAEATARFIASGELGELRVIHCRCLSADKGMPAKAPPVWRLIKAMNAGGILCNWGCYDLDYLLGITGWSLKPKVVLAQTWTVPPPFASHVAPGSDAETHFAAMIRCENGTMISFERGEYMPAQAENAWKIVGTKGSLHLQMTQSADKKIVFDRTSTEKGVIPEIIWQGDDSNHPTHQPPVHDFAAAILHGRPPRTTLEQALVVQQITDAVYASAERGTAVEVV